MQLLSFIFMFLMFYNVLVQKRILILIALSKSVSDNPDFRIIGFRIIEGLLYFPVSTFYKTVRGRMVCSNESLLDIVLGADVIQNLILELRAIVTEKDSKSRVRTDQMRHDSMSNSYCRLVTEWSQNHEATKMVDTNKDVDRTLSATMQLLKVDTNHVKGSSWKRIFKNRGSRGSTFCLSTRKAL